MKKSLLLLTATISLSLVGCAPSLSGPLASLIGPGPILRTVTGENSTLSASSNVLTFANIGDPAESTVFVLVGKDVGFKVDTAELLKVDPRANCYEQRQGWVCSVGTVNKAYGIPYAGELARAYVNFYRGTNKIPRTVAFP